MSYFKLYLILHFTNYCKVLCCISSIIGVFLLCLVSIFYFISLDIMDDEYKRILNRFFKMIVPTWLIITLLLGLVPSQEDSLKIIGMHYITNNDDLKSLPGDAVKLLRKSIDSKLNNKEGRVL